MSSLITSDISKFELHYYFDDGSHSIDVRTRHKCEGELLGIVKSIAELIEENVNVETIPSSTGGFIDVLVFLSSNPLVSNIFSNILVKLIDKPLSHDKEMNELQKQSLSLLIEKQKLEIKALKSENGLFEPMHVVDIISKDPRIIRHRSEFYRSIRSLPKINKISAKRITKDNTENECISSVERVDFDKYIIDLVDLPVMRDDNATILIISPVLNQGNYPWRGKYRGSVIDFSIKDKMFRESVVAQKMSFKNGTTILCSLEAKRKIDEFGVEYLSAYKVITVNSYIDGGVSVETESGKRIRERKLYDQSQLKLDGIES